MVRPGNLVGRLAKLERRIFTTGPGDQAEAFDWSTITPEAQAEAETLEAKAQAIYERTGVDDYSNLQALSDDDLRELLRIVQRLEELKQTRG